MKRNIWPYAIIAYFILFISAIIYWVSFAMRNDQQLVRSDYYEHEILYQKQIDRVARTANLESPALINYDIKHETLTVRIPHNPGQTDLAGKIHLYRPSDAKLDRVIPLVVDAQRLQEIDLSTALPGLWKVNLSWSMDGSEYFMEKSIVLN